MIKHFCDFCGKEGHGLKVEMYIDNGWKKWELCYACNDKLAEVVRPLMVRA